GGLSGTESARRTRRDRDCDGTHSCPGFAAPLSSIAGQARIDRAGASGLTRTKREPEKLQTLREDHATDNQRSSGAQFATSGGFAAAAGSVCADGARKGYSSCSPICFGKFASSMP